MSTEVVAQKRCSRCPEGEQWHPATTEYFQRDGNGFHAWCKTCYKAWKNARKEVVQEKQCTKCKKWKPADRDHFTVASKAKDGLYSQCKSCKAEGHQTSGARKKAVSLRHPSLNGHSHSVEPVGTPNQCGSCGTTKGNILGDVDKSTAYRYGYLCAKCRQLVRDFQGDPERIRNVLKYVEQTRLNKKVPSTV